MANDEIGKVFFSDAARYADLINGLGFSGRQVVKTQDVQERYGRMAEDAFDVAVAYTKSVELVGQKEEYRGEEGINRCKAIQDLMECSRHEGIEQGIEQGMEKGIAQGIERGMEQTCIQYNRLILYLNSHDRIQDMVKAAEDEQYRQKLFRELDEGQE